MKSTKTKNNCIFYVMRPFDYDVIENFRQIL